VSVIPNPVQYPLPVNNPVVVPDTVCKPGRKILLAVGTKPYQKGFDLLTESFCAVANMFPDWDLVILGLQGNKIENGLSTEHIVRQVASKGLTDRLFLIERVGNIADWYKTADLFVLSSRYEGFPNALIEAMSHGCPSIAFGCDTGPNEIISNNLNGCIVSDISSIALTGVMQECMSDSALRKKLSSKALECRNTYSAESVYAQWCKVFEITT
jgi:glycosyltransferase involved in cell wall biosynthesis